MLIGILQCGHLPEDLAAEYGAYDSLFRKLLGGRGYEFRTWNAVDMEFPDSPEDADAWLVTGSRHGVYEDLPFIAPLLQFIRDIRDAGTPLVGICFGHQAVAQALGGRVEKFAGGWSLGRVGYPVNGHALNLVAFHQDQVVERPEGAEVLASTPFCENAILAYGDRILTIQPHPEFDAGFTRDLLEARGKVLPADLVTGAAASLDQPLDTAATADMMAAVLEGRR
ncbi:type 1 glutamine amidotransferase [Rhodobacterales bacterium HKCCE2091]|nr:type 1 glutamine amidotransferase [Rhodobacterales bacterium HKCCE2091]